MPKKDKDCYLHDEWPDEREERHERFIIGQYLGIPTNAFSIQHRNLRKARKLAKESWANKVKQLEDSGWLKGPRQISVEEYKKQKAEE